MYKKLLALYFSTALSLFSAEKPNVLIFFIDDLGVKDLGVNGSTFFETPHIDALATSGVNFTNAFSAHPVCSPTRAALMTGKVPQRVGITQWINTKGSLALSEVTMGEAFKEAGYRTGYIGKWHLGKEDAVQPKHQGFDHTVAVNRAGQPASFFYPFKEGKKHTNVPDLGDYEEGDYLTDALTDKSIDFLSVESEQPFMLCLSYYAVHCPIQAPEKLVKKYEAKRKERFGEGEYKTSTNKLGKTVYTRQESPAYAAMLEALDTNIGRVMATLKEKGLLDNTIVIFSSDNGGLVQHGKFSGPTSNLPYRSGKSWNYDGGIRIPTMISWPGTIQPATSEARVITMDFYPTLLELSGLPLKPEQHLDGVSLKKVLNGEEDAQIADRFLAWSYPHKHGSGHKPSHAILSGDWKLIRYESDESTELFNVAKDVGEQKNLANENPEKLKELDTLLTEWLKETTP